MTRLLVRCRAAQGEVEVPSSCTGADIHTAARGVTDTGPFHSLRFIEDDEEIPNTARGYDLPDVCVVVPTEKLIVWVFGAPQERCRVLHVWPGDMPELLATPEIFPNGAFWDSGERVDPDHSWGRRVTRLHTLALGDRHESATEENWRGPCVCRCNLLEAPVECPHAWEMP